MASYFTGINSIDSLLAGEQNRFNSNSPVGTGVSLTYSFLTAVPYSAGAPENNNFVPLSEIQKDAVRSQLTLLSELVNVTFVEVAGSAGQIRYGTASYPNSSFSGKANYGSATVKSDVWLNNYYIDGDDATYSYSTLLHELGHAMGMSHPFEGFPQLPPETEHQQYTVMSYNVHVGVFEDPTTYMLYDIATLQHIYGANVSTRTGDTVYSWGDDEAFTMTLWDGGGNDTLDVSNFAERAIINLEPGSFSSAGVFVDGSHNPFLKPENNLAIALGVIIENAIGGSGNDVLTGNASANHLAGNGGADSLQGKGGADVFLFDATALADADAGVLDRITDYNQGHSAQFDPSEGDQIDLSSILAAQFLAGHGQSVTSLVRAVVAPTGASIVLEVDADGTDIASHWQAVAQIDGLQSSRTINVILDAAAPSGLAVAVSLNGGPFGDIDGNGKADLVWRNDDGVVATWSMDGGSILQGSFLTGVPGNWHIQGMGDFNGDGRSDILWLNDNGSLIDWVSADSAQTESVGTQPANTELAGIGDFNHDGKSDLIWRSTTDGSVTVSITRGSTATFTGTGNDWQVVGVGDYNGDGNADIMFRNAGQGVNAAWLLDGTSAPQTVFYSGVPNDWHAVGTGDFDGNGTADLLWHNDNGANAVWLMNTNGAVAQAGFFDGVGADWHVVGTGDFNGDHKDDILWRNDNGATAVWQMNGTQTPTVSFPGGVPNDWATQAHHYEYV